MKGIRGSISCILSFILALLLVAGFACAVVFEVVQGSALYHVPATWIREKQLAEMGETIDGLSDTYGFSREQVRASFDSAAFDGYGEEVRTFLQETFRLSDADADEYDEDYGEDLIFPYYMWMDGEDILLADEGFRSTVGEYDRRLVMRNEIVPVLEEKAQELVIPLRPALLVAGFEMVGEKVDLHKVGSVLGYWWVLPLSALAVILLLFVINRPCFAVWTGCGLAGGALMLVAIFVFVTLLGIPGYAGLVNPLFATYLRLMLCFAGIMGLAFILPGLVVGFLLIGHKRRAAQ